MLFNLKKICLLVALTIPLSAEAGILDKLHEKGVELKNKLSQDLKQNAEKAKDKLTDKSKEIHNTLKKSARTLKQKSQQSISDSTDVKHTVPFDYGLREYRKKTFTTMKTLYKKYGPKVGNQLHKVYQTYGPKVASHIGKAINKIRETSKTKLIDAYYAFSLKTAEKITEIYFRFGSDAGDNVYLATKMYGEEIGNSLANIYFSYGSEIGNEVAYEIEKYKSVDPQTFVRNAETIMSQINDDLQDPETAEKIIAVAAITFYIYTYPVRLKRDFIVDQSKALARRIYVTDKHGHIVNLEEYSQEYIRENFPFLVGTGIDEDPIKATIFLLVYHSTPYAFFGLKMVRTDDGELISLAEKLSEDPDNPSNNTKFSEFVRYYMKFHEDLVEIDSAIGYERIKKSAQEEF